MNTFEEAGEHGPVGRILQIMPAEGYSEVFATEEGPVEHPLVCWGLVEDYEHCTCINGFTAYADGLVTKVGTASNSLGIKGPGEKLQDWAEASAAFCAAERRTP